MKEIFRGPEWTKGIELLSGQTAGNTSYFDNPLHLEA